MENVGRRVTVYNRYLFAVPVKGTIVGISTHDGSYKIIFDKGQFPGLDNINKHDGRYFFPQECVLDDLPPEIPSKKQESVTSILIRKVIKLKQLMLLVDPAVSSIQVSETTAIQWNEYIKCFPDEV